MKTRLMIGLLVSIGASVYAQDMQEDQVSKVSQAYHTYRQVGTDPPYDLGKVKAMIAAIKPDPNVDGTILSAARFRSLSVKDKFTYCMLNAENFDQNCDATLGFVGEESKIYGLPLRAFYDQNTWSDRQRSFLHSNRIQVVSLLRGTMVARNRVGANLKQAVLEIDGYELIPDMLSIYKESRKDHDILSVCMVLMKRAQYKPFLVSATWKKLYGDSATTATAFVEANRANQDLEIARATAFYKSRRG